MVIYAGLKEFIYLSKNRNRNRKKGESFIDIRIRGTFEVEAKTREEAAEKVRDRIMEDILVAHPSFESTGLPPIWEAWLDSQSEKMLGIEVVEEDEEIDESLDVTWTNIEGREHTKGGQIILGEVFKNIDKRRKR